MLLDQVKGCQCVASEFMITDNRLPGVRNGMALAAQEENDHLLWCEQRLAELGSHKN